MDRQKIYGGVVRQCIFIKQLLSVDLSKNPSIQKCTFVTYSANTEMHKNNCEFTEHLQYFITAVLHPVILFVFF